MKLNRKRNSIRNVAYGTLYKCIGILGPFIVRTVMIYVMGTEYVGLNSLFTSLLSFLSLAELGVSSALVFSMYKPIAEDDTASINALYALYRRLYKIIGLIILFMGIAITPILHLLINKDLPSDVNLYLLYYIYLINTVLSYFLFGYKQSLLTAFQRSDIISKRGLIVQTCMFLLQIIALILTHNYYFYIIWLPCATIANNLFNKVVVDKMFPQYKCEGKVGKDVENSIKKKVIALFGTKANAIVLHATDNIVISAFLGLNMVGQYGNYYYIMNSISAFIKIIYSSITAGLGNSLQTESIEKNYFDFRTVTFLNSWLVMFCSTCLLCIYQPFMKIWVGESRMLGMDIVVLLVLYFYIYMIRRVVLTYKDAAGIWWEDRLRPYVVMAVNLVFNVGLCQIIGLYGIIISTILSMVIAIPWENYTIFKYIFNRSSKEYYVHMTVIMILSAAMAWLTYFLCCFIREGVLGILIRIIICVTIPNIIWILLFHRTEEFRRSIALIRKPKKHKK